MLALLHQQLFKSSATYCTALHVDTVIEKFICTVVEENHTKK